MSSDRKMDFWRRILGISLYLLVWFAVHYKDVEYSNVYVALSCFCFSYGLKGMIVNGKS